VCSSCDDDEQAICRERRMACEREKEEKEIENT
jgi:hypothetical protein